MKKILALLLTAAFVASASVAAFADNFAPSVTNKGAPALVTTTTSDGKQVAATVKSADGTVSALLDPTQITITPVAQKNQSSATVQATLTQAYEQLQKVDSIEQLVPEVKEVLQQVADNLGRSVTSDDMVVRDLFDVSIPTEAMDVLKAGGSIDLTFNAGVAQKDAVLVLHNFSGDQWEVIDSKNVKVNADGTLTVTLGGLSPIAIVVEKSAVKYNPSTGAGAVNPMDLVLFGAIATTSVLVLKKR